MLPSAAWLPVVLIPLVVWIFGPQSFEPPAQWAVLLQAWTNAGARESCIAIFVFGVAFYVVRFNLPNRSVDP